MKKLLFVFVGLLFVCGICLLDVNAEEQKEEIRVGIIGDLSGPTASLSSLAYGRRDYYTFLNEKDGGINGHMVDVTLVDGAEVIPVEVANYKRLITRHRPHTITVWSTSGAKALRKYLNERDRVPGISFSCAEDIVQPKRYPFNFVFGPTYEDQIRIAMLLAKKEGAKKVAMIGPTLGYSKIPRINIVNEKFFEKHGLELIADIDYNPRPQDLTPEMARLKRLGVDFVMVTDTPGGLIPAIRSAAKVGFDVSKLFGFHYSMHESVPRTCKDAANGLRAFSLVGELNEYEGTPVGKEISEFLTKHRRRNVDNMYVTGWLAAKCEAAAIKMALDKNDNKLPETIKFRKMIRDSLEQLKDFDIGAGPDFPRINYADHKGFVAAKVMKVVDGKWKAETSYVLIDEIETP